MSPPDQSARILVVDDDEGLLILIAETLRGGGYTVATANSARATRQWLEGNAVDLMILDLNLKDGSGSALVAALQRDREPVPFVVVTGQGDEKIAVEIMKQGALDYVMKDTALLDLLPTIVERALAAVAREQALRVAQAEHRRLEREVLAVSERERQTIGADLHDNLGQQLTALELMCTALKADAVPYPSLADGLDRMGRMLREAITQTRALAHGLVPVGSDPDALQIGLTQLADRMSSLGRIRCELDCPSPVLVADPFVASHLFRIAQEAVNNAVKHARARRVGIRLVQENAQLTLEVRDDGGGLPKNPAKQRGLGLGVMRHRARAIGAELEIVSKRGEGVCVACRLNLSP